MMICLTIIQKKFVKFYMKCLSHRIVIEAYAYTEKLLLYIDFG